MNNAELKKLFAMSAIEVIKKYKTSPHLSAILTVWEKGQPQQEKLISQMDDAELITAVGGGKILKEGQLAIKDIKTPPASTSEATEQDNGKNQKSKLLNLLKDGEWHDTLEIMNEVYNISEDKGIARIGARIYDLKQDGHEIESRKKRKTIWEYRLIKIIN